MVPRFAAAAANFPRSSWPGLRRTTRFAPLRALRSIKCGESEPATSSLRYATGRARSAPALLKIGPAGHRLPLGNGGASREPTSARFLDVIAALSRNP
jgi:hypothetical protein